MSDEQFLSWVRRAGDMSDWHGTTGRDDLVGGGNETQYSTTIDDITLCSVAPFTDEEISALREYFRLLAAKRAGETGYGEQEMDERRMT